MLVYKYRGGAFNRDLKSLKEDKLWASNTSQLNDPCEGLITISDIHEQLNIVRNLFPQHKENISSIEKSLHNLIGMKDSKLGVFSLSKRYDDELLWAHYANSHKGFCIEYNLELLIANQQPKHRYFDVQYSNSVPNLNFSKILEQKDPDTLIKTMLGYKSERWHYENELRIITEVQGSNSYDYRAVKAIYFGLKTPNEEIISVMDTLQGRKIKYFQMYLEPNSFKFEARPIEDKFPTNEKYKYFIAPITEDLDSVICYLKAEYKPYSECIKKLAEIVRREPECHEVTCIDISLGKSTPLNPIFFAHYKNSENDWPQQIVFYTKTQIDEEYAKIDDL